MNDDTISRQAAIDAFMTSTSDGDKAEWCKWVLEQLPSAERRGRWVVQIENETFNECKCSECGCVEYFNKGWKRFNYCPNCGARMEETP